MQRRLISILASGALLIAATGSAFAQSGGAGTSGGATSNNTSTSDSGSGAPAPDTSTPMVPGPPAPPGAAPYLSDAALIGIGAAALIAGVVIAVSQNGSHPSSTTTTSTR